MLLVRFLAILRWQPFSSSLSRTLIYRPTRERSYYNFCALPLPIFIIWPKYATRTISWDSARATFLARVIAHANIPAPWERSFYYFRPRLLSVFVIWPKYATYARSRDSKRATFSREQSHMLISWSSRECSIYNFRARPLLIFVIRPKYAARAISRNSEMTSPFE